jgi:hypothetical protein
VNLKVFFAIGNLDQGYVFGPKRSDLVFSQTFMASLADQLGVLSLNAAIVTDRPS